MTPHSLAAIFHQAGSPLELKQLPTAELRAGEILVEVTCCTLCGSDLHSIRGDRPVAGPTVLGHEMIGRIRSLGSSSRDLRGVDLRVGDRIIWSIAVSCHNCFFCNNALPQKCERLFKYGHEVAREDEPCHGGLAQLCHLVPGTTVIKLPQDLPDTVAAPANCATATCAAALRTAGAVAGRTVIIQGAGMLGLTAAAMCRQARAANVIVTDLSALRLQLASKFGATAVFDARDQASVQNAIAQNTDGRGGDVLFEMSGSAEALENSFLLLRPGGHLLLVGAVSPSRPIAVSPEQLVRKMLSIDGVHNYVPQDLLTAITFLEATQRTFPFHELVGAEFSLTEVNHAVQHALNTDSPRIAVRPDRI